MLCWYLECPSLGVILSVKFNIKLDLSNLGKRQKEALNKAQVILDEQVRKDSNFYAPMDTSNLIGSSTRASTTGNIVWDVPYARRLYYNPQYNFSKDRNPYAQGLWFEVAKSKHLKDWLKIINLAMR